MTPAERIRRLLGRTHSVTPRPAADEPLTEEDWQHPEVLRALPLRIEDAPRLPHVSQSLIRKKGDGR